MLAEEVRGRVVNRFPKRVDDEQPSNAPDCADCEPAKHVSGCVTLSK